MDWFFEQSVVVQIIIGILFVFGVWQGYISVAWLNIKKNVKRHEDCPLYPDYLISLDRARSEAMKIAHSPYFLIRDQMTQTEDIQEDIVSMLSAHYLKLLKQYRNGQKNGLINDAEYKDYMHIIDLVMIRVKKKVLTFYRENHLAEMTDEEFRHKSKERIHQIVRIFSTEMNTIYSSRMNIPREAIYDHNKVIIPDVEDKLEDMFVRAKSLAVEAKERIAQ